MLIYDVARPGPFAPLLNRILIKLPQIDILVDKKFVELRVTENPLQPWTRDHYSITFARAASLEKRKPITV